MSGASATFRLLFTGDETYAVIKQLHANLKRMQIGWAKDGVAKAAAWVRRARGAMGSIG